jgi:hypothetical protein
LTYKGNFPIDYLRESSGEYPLILPVHHSAIPESDFMGRMNASSTNGIWEAVSAELLALILLAFDFRNFI